MVDRMLFLITSSICSSICFTLCRSSMALSYMFLTSFWVNLRNRSNSMCSSAYCSARRRYSSPSCRSFCCSSATNPRFRSILWRKNWLTISVRSHTHCARWYCVRSARSLNMKAIMVHSDKMIYLAFLSSFSCSALLNSF